MKNFLIKLINKFYNFINIITKDQVLHSYCSSMLVLLIFIICLFFNLSLFLSLIISCVLTIIIGFAKEYIIDLLLRKTKAEKQDLIADLIGTILGLIITILYLIYINNILN